MDGYQFLFINETILEATKANHIFPEMAACEAALESGYGTSGLSIADHNLFGMKQHKHPVYGTHVLPTRECINSHWVTVMANWIKYPDEAACFADRMATLQRLSSYYPHYKEALEAPDQITYVTEVSKTWSTDPERANKVIHIYNSYMGQ